MIELLKRAQDLIGKKFTSQYIPEARLVYTDLGEAIAQLERDQLTYLTRIPDHHDRYVWRNRYYALREYENTGHDHVICKCDDCEKQRKHKTIYGVLATAWRPEPNKCAP